MNTGKILLDLRRQCGLSQEEMAEKLFVTRQAVSRWENEETVPSVDTFKIIAKVFGVPIGHLLGLEGDNKCLFKQKGFVFSYRVAGILVRGGKVLLQKPNNTGEYAFPGGHVAFGETTAEALVRRWHEETGLSVEVGELKWVEENMFIWGGKPCHQICLDYIVNIKGSEVATVADGMTAFTYAEGDKDAVCFYWVPLGELQKLKVYPEKAAELLLRLNEPVQHLAHFEDAAKK